MSDNLLTSEEFDKTIITNKDLNSNLKTNKKQTKNNT